MSKDLKDMYYEWREVEMKILWLLKNDAGKKEEKRLRVLRKIQHWLQSDSRHSTLREDFVEEIEWLVDQLN